MGQRQRLRQSRKYVWMIAWLAILMTAVVGTAVFAQPEIDLQRPVGTTIPNDGVDMIGECTRLYQTVVEYRICNTGNAPLVISGIGVRSYAHCSLTYNAHGFTVEPGDTAVWQVGIYASGAVSATFRITSNDADEGNYDFTICGTTISPEINIERPVSMTIPDDGSDPQGVKKAGEQVTLTYTVRNTGMGDLKVYEVRTRDLSNVSVDTISPTGFPMYSVAANGGTATFHVSYTPNADGLFSFRVLISSTDEDEFHYYITVTGDATPPDVTINQAAGQSDPASSSLALFTTVFSRPIKAETFTPADVAIGGTATAGAVTVTEIAPNDGTTFGVSIVVTGDGTVIPTIPAGVVEDIAGNMNNASTSDDNKVTCLLPLKVALTRSAGEGSFLDRCLDLEEGEEPPMVGLRPLTAIYEAGEAVSGACLILNPGGQPVRGSYIHVYIYWVNLEERPETVALLDHWIVRYDPEAGAYCYSWDTTETAPGTYDICLAFADGSGHTCRIQLTEPVE